MPTTTFQTGQRVRLATMFHGKPLSTRACHEIQSPRGGEGLTWLAAGTILTVGAKSRNYTGAAIRRRFDGPTVLVHNADGTWCIPARLLEAVEETQPTDKAKESASDTEGDRLG